MPEGIHIKAVSCLLRQSDKFSISAHDVVHLNGSPRDGDIILARCLSSDGCYTSLMDQNGLMTRLYKGDVIVSVLANRKSGYGVSAEIPAGPIQNGDVLGLIYHSGVVSKPIFVPDYIGKNVMPLEVVGFARGRSAPVANISESPPINVSEWSNGGRRAQRILFIAGTSSECGKTTFMANFNLAVKRGFPEIVTAAVKACGTGSSRDKLSLQHANYDYVVDFVDAGLATTYDIELSRFRDAFAAIMNFAQARADLVVVEVGGDFLEANAPEVLRTLAKRQASCVLQVNDAMGALEGLRRLQALDVRPIAIGCFRQNLASLMVRLGAEGHAELSAIDSRDEPAMDALASAFVAPMRAADRPS